MWENGGVRGGIVESKLVIMQSSLVTVLRYEGGEVHHNSVALPDCFEGRHSTAKLARIGTRGFVILIKVQLQMARIEDCCQVLPSTSVETDYGPAPLYAART